MRCRDQELEVHSEEVQKLVHANSSLQRKCKELENAKILLPSQRPNSSQMKEMKEERVIMFCSLNVGVADELFPFL